MSRSLTVGGILGFLLITSLSGVDVTEAQPLPQGDPDFLFERPRGSIGVRGGWLFERAGSDLFTFVNEQLTIEPNDFDAPTLALDIGVVAGSRTEAVFGVEFGGATVRSEYRDFVDNDRLPITQATRLRQANLSASLKLALTPHGQEIGSIAWVPNAITPFVGAGARSALVRIPSDRRLRRLPRSISVQRDVPVARLGPERARVRRGRRQDRAGACFSLGKDDTCGHGPSWARTLPASRRSISPASG